MTNAESPATKSMGASARLERKGLPCITAPRSRPLSARMISVTPIAQRKKAETYFHMTGAYYYRPGHGRGAPNNGIHPTRTSAVFSINLAGGRVVPGVSSALI